MIKRNKIVDLSLPSGNKWLAYNTRSFISYTNAEKLLLENNKYRIPSELDYVELFNSANISVKNDKIRLMSKVNNKHIFFSFGYYWTSTSHFITDSARKIYITFGRSNIETFNSTVYTSNLKLRLIKNDNSN